MLCEIADVSRSGYYCWLKNINKPDKDYGDYLLIKAIYEQGKGKYGWRTIQMKLRANMGMVMNHKKIQRIKIKYQLFTKIRRLNPYKAIMKKTQEHRTFENILNRNFNQAVPFHTFGTDITYLPFNHRLAYLSAVKDFASGEIVHLPPPSRQQKWITKIAFSTFGFLSFLVIHFCRRLVV